METHFAFHFQEILLFGSGFSLEDRLSRFSFQWPHRIRWGERAQLAPRVPRLAGLPVDESDERGRRRLEPIGSVLDEKIPQSLARGRGD